MKKLFSPFLTTCLIATCMLSSCQKEKEKPVESSPSTDEQAFQEESDEFLEIAEYYFTNVQAATRTSGSDKECGATVDTKNLSTHKQVTLTFDGTVKCGKDKCLKREGVVQLILSKGDQWSDKGAEITMNFHNYTVARNCDNRCINLDGKKTYTNETGGLVKSMAAGDSIIHLINGTGMKLIYDNHSSTRDWNSQRRRVFVKTTDEMAYYVFGEGSTDSLTNLAMWGTERDGTPYYVTITEAIKYKLCSGGWKAVSGVRVRKGKKEVTTTFGVDKDGNVINNCGAFGYKKTWVSSTGVLKTEICKY